MSGLLLWAVPAVTASLGVWQVYRREWKLRLIQQAEDHIINGTAKRLTDARSVNASKEEFQRVVVQGTFEHDKEILLGPRVRKDCDSRARGNIGYTVFTPFRLAESNDEVVLVNRGWIPDGLRDDRRRNKTPATVEIEGIIRDGEPVGAFSRLLVSNKPEKGVWLNIDLNQMAKTTGSLPLIVQMTSQSYSSAAGFPLVSEAQVHLVNNHLEYALTWFAMCAASSLMLLRKRVARCH